MQNLLVTVRKYAHLFKATWNKRKSDHDDKYVRAHAQVQGQVKRQTCWQTDRQRKFQAYVVHYIVWTFTHVYGRHQSKTKVKNQLYSSTFENNRGNWKKGCSGTRLKYRSCWSGSVLNQGQRNSLDDLNLAHSLPVPSTYGSSINSKLTFLLQEVNNLVKSASFVLRVMSMIDRQPVKTYQQILFERSSYFILNS